MRGGDKQEALSFVCGRENWGKTASFPPFIARARSWSLVPRCYGRSGHETTTNRRHPRKGGLVHVHTCKQFPTARTRMFSRVAVKDLLDHQRYDGRRNWFKSSNISLQNVSAEECSTKSYQSGRHHRPVCRGFCRCR